MSEEQDVEEGLKGGVCRLEPAGAGSKCRMQFRTRVATLQCPPLLLLLHGNELTKIQLQ